MRVASAVFCAVFLLAVAVQWNDPDPLVWMLGYGLAALLSLAAFFGRFPVLPNALAAAGFAVWFLALAGTLPSAPLEAFTSFRMQTAAHEQPREAVGLLLCCAWTAFLAMRGARERPSRAS